MIKKNCKFSSFQFCPIPKIDNSEMSTICLLIQILRAVVVKSLKTTKI